jgi:hypothetical protein
MGTLELISGIQYSNSAAVHNAGSDEFARKNANSRYGRARPSALARGGMGYGGGIGGMGVTPALCLW